MCVQFILKERFFLVLRACEFQGKFCGGYCHRRHHSPHVTHVFRSVYERAVVECTTTILVEFEVHFAYPF